MPRGYLPQCITSSWRPLSRSIEWFITSRLQVDGESLEGRAYFAFMCLRPLRILPAICWRASRQNFVWHFATLEFVVCSCILFLELACARIRACSTDEHSILINKNGILVSLRLCHPEDIEEYNEFKIMCYTSSDMSLGSLAYSLRQEADRSCRESWWYPCNLKRG